MTKEALIKETLQKLSDLPKEKIVEVLDFTDFLAKKHDESILLKGIVSLSSSSQVFDFLESEEEVYSKDDLKIIYKRKKEI